MTRKRVGGWVWWLAATIGALVIGFGGYVYVAFTMYEPWSANFDPLIRSIQRDRGSSWAGQAEMKPCCFATGELKSAVLRRLEASEFKTDAPTGWDQKFFGAYLAPGVAIYSRSASRFPCMDTFFVVVEFDGEDRLKKAEGTWINAACV